MARPSGTLQPHCWSHNEKGVIFIQIICHIHRFYGWKMKLDMHKSNDINGYMVAQYLLGNSKIWKSFKEEKAQQNSTYGDLRASSLFLSPLNFFFFGFVIIAHAHTIRSTMYFVLTVKNPVSPENPPEHRPCTDNATKDPRNLILCYKARLQRRTTGRKQ